MLVAASNHRANWSLPFGMVALTFLIWYLIEPIYTPQTLSLFSRDILDITYRSAFIFIVSFSVLFFLLRPLFSRTMVRPSARIMQKRLSGSGQGVDLPRQLTRSALILWLALFAIGIFRLDGDVMQALLPEGGRWTNRMWGRGSVGGAGGFLISTAGYVYILLLASFGPLLVIVRQRPLKWLILTVILISWPAIFLSGARSTALFVVSPLIIAALFYARLSWAWKGGLLIVALIAIEFVFRVMISTRNVGIDTGMPSLSENVTHDGLNMTSELAWVVQFVQSGRLAPDFGGRYLAELLNFVPRALWPEKPLIGIDYAILRGFADSSFASGVSTTISTGMIGQGIVNFGVLFGPVAAATLMACWANLLGRFGGQATIGRQLLFLLGLALTFNLGRDITLLVLFPFVFAYVLVRIFERSQKGGRGSRSPRGLLGHHEFRAFRSRK